MDHAASDPCVHLKQAGRWPHRYCGCCPEQVVFKVAVAVRKAGVPFDPDQFPLGIALCFAKVNVHRFGAEVVQRQHTLDHRCQGDLDRKGLLILRRQGTVAHARYKLEAIDRSPRNQKWNHPNDFQKAQWQIIAGLNKETLASLTEMVQAHDPKSLQFAASPAYLKLHRKPEFNELLKQVGLPQP